MGFEIIAILLFLIFIALCLGVYILSNIDNNLASLELAFRGFGQEKYYIKELGRFDYEKPYIKYEIKRKRD